MPDLSTTFTTPAGFVALAAAVSTRNGPLWFYVSGTTGATGFIYFVRAGTYTAAPGVMRTQAGMVYNDVHISPRWQFFGSRADAKDVQCLTVLSPQFVCVGGRSQGKGGGGCAPCARPR